MTIPADEITTSEAATLLGISGAMLRRVASQGYIERHARGKTTVTSAVQGYARFLKDDGQRSDVNEAQARSHRAKAARIRRETERRRAALTDRAEVEQVIETVADTACRCLRAIDLTGEVDGKTARAFATEIKGACERIKAEQASAIQSLRGQEAEHE
jgi:predicted transcriptional regulator of viral defense system